MFETPHTSGGGFAKENERNIYGQEWCFTAAHSNSATFDGIGFGHVKCHKWDFVCTNKVQCTMKLCDRDVLLVALLLFSQEDIENFKAEIEKRQLAEESETADQNVKPVEISEDS